MQTARRLYVYLLAGIGLGVLVSGISLLLTTVLEAVGIGGGAVLSGEQATRERLTLATAMTAVSLPVWLIHWFLAERSVHPDRAAADVERSSAMRGLYFALVLGGLLIAAFVTLDSLITDAVLALLGEDVAFATHAGDIGLFVTAAAAWGYHLAIRLRDWRRGPIHGAGAWLPRAYLYVATFVGLFVMLFGLAQLLGLVARLALGDGAEPFDSSASWWALPLASALSPVIAGGATWLGHWWYASRLWADPGYRGTIERPARLRFAGFVVVLVVSAASALGFGGEVGRLVLGALLGVTDADPGAGGLLPDLVAAGAAAVLFAGTWWLHAGWLRRAADDPEAAGVVPRVDRLIAYPTALVGLAFGAVGIARLLGLVLDLLLGGGRVLSSGETSERVFAQFVPYAVLGIGTWLWHWSTIRRAVAADPAAEAASTVRRGALLLTLAVSLLAGVASLGVVLYRLFGTLFGLEVPGDVTSQLSLPLGTLAVTVAVAVIHGRLLRADASVRGEDAEPAAVVAAAAAPEVSLRLVGPAGTEPGTLAGVADALRAQLPEGFELRDDRRMS